jgi:hypothetical protein
MGVASAGPPLSGRMAAQRGALTAVTASAPSVPVGGTLTVTASGTNPCGAAHINYGDGIAITYAISALPTSQTHVYQKPGTYAIVARGMGNCDGEATTRVEVTGPAPAPPPEVPNAITAIEFVPRPGVVRQPVAINVSGRGTCAFTVTFGDGNQQELNGPLPQRVSHTYAVEQTYTVIVAPAPPCAGKFSDKLQVAARGGNRITGLAIDPMPTNVGRAVTIDVEGAGACSYHVDYGDGNGEDRSKPLPDRLRHVYNTAGSYVIRVEASGGCAGRAQRTLDVR